MEANNFKNKLILNKKLKNSLKYQEILFETIIKLIEANNFHDSINYVLDLVGTEFKLSRIIIFQDNNDRSLSKSIYSWYSCDAKNNSDLGTLYYNKNFYWDKLLEFDGKIYSNNIEELPKGIKELLKSQNVLSILVYPLYINNKRIGFIRFDQCKCHRKITEDKLEFFQKLSKIISSFYGESINKEEILKKVEVLDNIVDIANMGTWKLDLRTDKCIIDELYANIIGYNLRNLKSNYNIRNKIIEESDLKKSNLLMKQYIDGKVKSYNCKVRMKHKNDQWIWIHEKANIIEWDKNGSPISLFGIIFDITDYAEINEKELKVIKAIEDIELSFILTDKNGIIEYITSSYIKKTGYFLSELIGRNIRELNGSINLDISSKSMLESIDKGIEWDGELINRRKDGEVYYEEVKVTPIKDEKNITSGFIIITKDITKKKYLEEKQKQNAVRDSLTNLYNRKYLHEKLGQAIEKYKKKKISFSVAMLDIDHFKKINDKHGHIAGDFILKEFSEILINGIRTYDVLGRYGGEEFIIILQEIPKESAKKVIERILNKIRDITFKFKDKDIQITFSCGISDVYEIDKYNLNIEKVIEIADKKLYLAKESGRNKIIID